MYVYVYFHSPKCRLKIKNAAKKIFLDYITVPVFHQRFEVMNYTVKFWYAVPLCNMVSENSKFSIIIIFQQSSTHRTIQYFPTGANMDIIYIFKFSHKYNYLFIYIYVVILQNSLRIWYVYMMLTYPMIIKVKRSKAKVYFL